MGAVERIEEKPKKKNKNFTMVPNEIPYILGNPRLSGMYLFLKTFEGKNGLVFPSLSYIARVQHISKRTAIRMINALEEKGVLKVERRKGKSNIYRFVDSSELKEKTKWSTQEGLHSVDRNEYYFYEEISSLKREIEMLKQKLVTLEEKDNKREEKLDEKLNLILNAVQTSGLTQSKNSVHFSNDKRKTTYLLDNPDNGGDIVNHGLNDPYAVDRGDNLLIPGENGQIIYRDDDNLTSAFSLKNSDPLRNIESTEKSKSSGDSYNDKPGPVYADTPSEWSSGDSRIVVIGSFSGMSKELHEQDIYNKTYLTRELEQENSYLERELIPEERVVKKPKKEKEKEKIYKKEKEKEKSSTDEQSFNKEEQFVKEKVFALKNKKKEKEKNTILPAKEKERKEDPPVRGKSSVPPCPQDEIIQLYHEILPMLPRVRIWKGQRRKMLEARWKEDRERQNLDWWKEYFEYVFQSDFLIGKTGKWSANLEWLIRPENMVKVLNGNYHGRNSDYIPTLGELRRRRELAFKDYRRRLAEEEKIIDVEAEEVRDAHSRRRRDPDYIPPPPDLDKWNALFGPKEVSRSDPWGLG